MHLCYPNMYPAKPAHACTCILLRAAKDIPYLPSLQFLYSPCVIAGCKQWYVSALQPDQFGDVKLGGLLSLYAVAAMGPAKYMVL